jgi:hypothetical protein
MEWKWDSEVMPDGQKFTLFALSRVRGFTVLLVRGTKPGSPEGYCVIDDGAFGEPHLTTQDDFRSRVEKWFTTGRWPEGDA